MTTATMPTRTAELTRLDRCDRCGAQAYVRATLPATAGTSLLFCGHHFRRHEAALVATGATILDERYRLTDAAAEPEA